MKIKRVPSEVRNKTRGWKCWLLPFTRAASFSPTECPETRANPRNSSAKCTSVPGSQNACILRANRQGFLMGDCARTRRDRHTALLGFLLCASHSDCSRPLHTACICRENNHIPSLWKRPRMAWGKGPTARTRAGVALVGVSPTGLGSGQHSPLKTRGT